MHFSRRAFTQSLMAGSVFAPAASFGSGRTQSAQKKINYCIVGLGRISLQHFMPGCKGSQNSQVTALVSGHREKANQYAAEYQVPASSIYNYENFDEIAKNPNIDAVYIALPNSMHAEYTIRAAKAGKHVFCEKPMATSVKDSVEMIDACKSAGKKLMLAYRCQYQSTNLRAVRLIREGKLGTIQAIESANGFVEKAGEWRLSGKLAGGGPLMDVGIYSLNACRFLTGEEPEHLEGYCSTIDKDGRFDEVEENLSWTMRFPSGVVASCNTTYGANMPGFVRVHGTKGMLHMEPAFSYEGIRFKAQIHGEPDIDEMDTAKDPAQFAREADYFSQCILEDKEPKTNGAEGLRDMRLMAAIYKSCGRSLG
jgi:predicted dehydrogenase